MEDIARLKDELKKKINVKEEGNVNIKADIEQLLQSPEQSTSELDKIDFHVESLEALDSRLFHDYSGKNIYFNIFYRTKKITVNGTQTSFNNFRDVATVLQSTLVEKYDAPQTVSEDLLKTIDYPIDPSPDLKILLADINHNFQYIKPRLNTMNLSSLLDSSKSLLSSAGNLFTSANRRFSIVNNLF